MTTFMMGTFSSVTYFGLRERVPLTHAHLSVVWDYGAVELWDTIAVLQHPRWQPDPVSKSL